MLSMATCYMRARCLDGTECNIDLVELESALEGTPPGEYYLLPDSGKILYQAVDDILEVDEPEGDETGSEIPPDALPIDPIETRTRFRWMEEFIHTVHSVTAQSALRHALRQRKPFHGFKDVLVEYPAVREQWFNFEAGQIRREAIELVESLDWEILEVIDTRPLQSSPSQPEASESVPITPEEHEWILRGASQIAAQGGRTQLALLLKGSRNKSILKHNLDRSPAYGKLSFLTIEEIENRIDELIRTGELRTEFVGDLPLVVLTDEAWEQVRPWANRQQAMQAAEAAARPLEHILLKWRQLPRAEQLHLVDAVASLDLPNARHTHGVEFDRG
jgi:hypothetical protein